MQLSVADYLNTDLHTAICSGGIHVDSRTIVKLILTNILAFLIAIDGFVDFYKNE